MMTTSIKPQVANGSEKAMAPNSSTLAWRIPRTEEPGGLQCMGSRRVGHDWATSLSLFTFMHWKSKWQPTPVFLPGESQGRGAWWAAVYGITQSWTQLKWLSSSRSFLITRNILKLFKYPYGRVIYQISLIFCTDSCLHYIVSLLQANVMWNSYHWLFSTNTLGRRFFPLY